MEDILGNKLNLGDKVIYSRYRCANLRIGTIERIGSFTITVIGDSGFKRIIRKSQTEFYLVKV